MKNIIEALAVFLMWAGFAAASGFLMGGTNPHGMAGFVYSSVVLGLVGGIAFPVLSNLTATDLDVRSRLCVCGGIGLLLGAISFPISTLIAERSLHVPRDPFQIALFAYLCALGASLGCLADMAQRRIKRFDRNDASPPRHPS